MKSRVTGFCLLIAGIALLCGLSTSAPCAADADDPAAGTLLADENDSLFVVTDSLASDAALAVSDTILVAADSTQAADDSSLVPPVDEDLPVIETDETGDGLQQERAEEPAVDGFDLFTAPILRDEFGYLARWSAYAADTATVRPFQFAVRHHPVQDPLLARIVRTFRTRHLLRVELDARPDYFASSDSIAVVTDARIDSLLENSPEDVAPGLFYRASQHGGVRYIYPTLRNLERRSTLTWDHSVDLERGRISRQLLRDGIPVFRPVSEPYGDYMLHLTRRTVRRVWGDEVTKSMQSANIQGSGRQGLVRIALPFELPKAIKSIFGEGKPNLSVSGSERITFGGRSRWFPHRQNSEFQKKQSKFPQLEMEQDLTIRLKGSIGDKLDVDVDQSSKAETSLANRIKIHYKGYEDEIIQRVDLGNTSLKLPGTEYVSYGGKHTGLFGISAEAQLGPVGLNVILSKEEGETAEVRASQRSKEEEKRIFDYQYIRDRFFFLDDPNEDAYPEYPQYVVDIMDGSVELFLDDGDGPAVEEYSFWRGVAVLDLDSARPGAGDAVSDTLYFEKLIPNKDFWIYMADDRFGEGGAESHPYVILNRYLTENHTLAAIYKDQVYGRDVGTYVVEEDILFAKMIRPKTELLSPLIKEGTWGKSTNLMLKNIYPILSTGAGWTDEGIPEANILEEGFELTIHWQGAIGDAQDPDEIGGVKLIRHLGLDYRKETDTGYINGQDGIADHRFWVDFAHGLIFFPDLEPFAPGTNPGALRGRPGTPDQWDILPEANQNTGIYKQRSCVRENRGLDDTWTSRFYIDVAYRTPVTELRIEAWDIIEGSEVVRVGGRRLSKDRDYRIDYQTGTINLLNTAGVSEDDEVSVVAKRAGGFGMASKTLLGAAVFYQPEDSKLSFSSSWLYEKRGSPDRRPRLGSEPTRTAVGEFAGRYGTESLRLTQWLDKLPLLDVRKPSTFHVEGGLGVSFPNPNTRNDLYIDDFEGVSEEVYVRMTRPSWKPCGVPLSVSGDDVGSRAARRGELWWYTPRRLVQEGDLNPTLDYQEANDYRQVLELQVWPYEHPFADEGSTETWGPGESWGGLVQALSTSNLDLSRARFLDVWINDFVPWHEGEAWPLDREGIMHVELGRVSEDALWARREVACLTGDCDEYEIEGGPLAGTNGGLDNEDRSLDGELDVSDDLERYEDTGLDMIYPGVAGDSPTDDYYYDTNYSDEQIDDPDDLYNVWKQINGTENNTRLDTEDLDGDNSLDLEDSYFEYAIDLSDSSYVETDVTHDYSDREAWKTRGWRRIRIPLMAPNLAKEWNDPAWTDVKHLRIWFEGLSGRTRLQIGAVEIRSNRWLADAIRDTFGLQIPVDELLAKEEDFFPGVVNNKENSDTYTPPFAEHKDRNNDNIREREQSLTMELKNFQPGHTASVYQTYRQTQDYTGYESMEFWVNSTLLDSQDAEFFIRLCKEASTDTTHYYEYRTPVPTRASTDVSGAWLPVKIQLSELSELKLIAEQDTTDAPTALRLSDGAQLRLKGHPYLTDIRRITLGVVNTSSHEPIEDGGIWIDELRLTHVYKESDYAYRVQVRTELSDFAKFDLSYKRVGADFVGISGSSRGGKQNQTSLAANTSMPLDRLFPTKLDLKIPFSFSYTKNRTIPKYRTNDDILVADTPTDRDITQTVTRNTSFSLSRKAANRGWTRFTIDAISLSASLKESYQLRPQSRDSTRTGNLAATYNANLNTFGDMKFYKNWTVRLIPTNLSVSMNRGWREQVRYRRESSDLSKPYVKDDLPRETRSGTLSLSSGLRPIQPVSYTFKQNRNLMLTHRDKLLGGMNIGTETSRTEDLAFTQTLKALRGWIEPRLTWKGNFQGKFHEQNTGSGGELERSNTLTNSQTTSVSGELPLKKLFAALGDLTRRDESADQPEEGADEGGEGEEGGEEDEGDERDEEELPAGSQSRIDPERGAAQAANAGRQTGGGAGGSSALSRLFTINRTNANLSTSKRHTVNRTLGEPTMTYQLGLSSDPGVLMLGNGRETISENKTFGFDTDLRILGAINATAKVHRTASQTVSSGTKTGTVESRWPEVDLRWPDLSRYIGLKRWFKNIKATTRYARRVKSRSQEGRDTARETNQQWAPLVNLETNFKSGISASLRVDHSSFHKEDMGAVGQTQDRTSTGVKLSAKKSFTITREITVPLKNTKEKINTRLDLGLGINYDLEKQISQTPGSKPQVMGDTRKFDFSLTGSYQFTRTVTGKLLIAYGDDADHKNKTRSTRYVNVNISAGFTF